MQRRIVPIAASLIFLNIAPQAGQAEGITSSEAAHKSLVSNEQSPNTQTPGLNRFGFDVRRSACHLPMYEHPASEGRRFDLGALQVFVLKSGIAQLQVRGLSKVPLRLEGDKPVTHRTALIFPDDGNSIGRPKEFTLDGAHSLWGNPTTEDNSFVFSTSSIGSEKKVFNIHLRCNESGRIEQYRITGADVSNPQWVTVLLD